jgi:hypothetical protein
MPKKKKQVWEKSRPKKLGAPKSFNTKSEKYKKVKRRADRLFGGKVSLVKNIYISRMLKKRSK